MNRRGFLSAILKAGVAAAAEAELESLKQQIAAAAQRIIDGSRYSKT